MVRVAKVLLRVAGWLLTPLVLIAAASIGATIGLVVAPRFSPTAALVITVLLSLASAIIGLILWVGLLHENPQLRERLAVTPEGIPDRDVAAKLVHPEAP